MADGGRGGDLLQVVGTVLAHAARSGAAKADVLAAGIAERAGVTVDAGRVVAASALALGLGGVGLAVSIRGQGMDCHSHAQWQAVAAPALSFSAAPSPATRSISSFFFSRPSPPSRPHPQVRSLLGAGGAPSGSASGLVDVDATLVPLLLPTGMLSVAAPGGVDAAKLAAAGATAHRTLLRQVAFLLEHSPDAFRALPLSVLQGCVVRRCWCGLLRTGATSGVGASTHAHATPAPCTSLPPPFPTPQSQRAARAAARGARGAVAHCRHRLRVRRRACPHLPDAAAAVAVRRQRARC